MPGKGLMLSIDIFQKLLLTFRSFVRLSTDCEALGDASNFMIKAFLKLRNDKIDRCRALSMSSEAFLRLFLRFKVFFGAG